MPSIPTIERSALDVRALGAGMALSSRVQQAAGSRPDEAAPDGTAAAAAKPSKRLPMSLDPEFFHLF